MQLRIQVDTASLHYKPEVSIPDISPTQTATPKNVAMLKTLAKRIQNMSSSAIFIQSRDNKWRQPKTNNDCEFAYISKNWT